ncbi:MAG: D-sedoheptulose 7-phosphate isomerase [Blastocatellia bacterium]|jgi:D-sedoheptulose 7-phosphate isomerase|nr:D-sedoheptulose 7-phosphate isomerase [Blastocatellia bacterium]
MKELMSYVIREIEENACVTADLAQSCSGPIIEAANAILSCLQAGGKLIAFGNGGSAAEAEHFVTELIGRYRTDRQALAAVSLTTDATSLTAIGNDYGFECIFSRQLQAIARPNDVVLAISTSGNSPNILRAVEAAGVAGLFTIGLTGVTGGELRGLVRICIGVPSNSTPRIQEAHSLIVHILCGIVEDAVVSDRHPAGGIERAIEEVR